VVVNSQKASTVVDIDELTELHNEVVDLARAAHAHGWAPEAFRFPFQYRLMANLEKLGVSPEKLAQIEPRLNRILSIIARKVWAA
jgi:hypothetical protein